MSAGTIFVGIDPGLTGAIALIDEDSRPIAVIDVCTRRRPTKTTVMQREVDTRQTADQLTDRLVNYVEHRWLGAIEMPFSVPGGNVMGMTSLFQTYGSLLAMLEMAEVETTQIKPAEWKKGFGLTKSKNLSTEIAQQMWPTAGITRKKDHNRAEALLIAEYRRLIWKREEMEKRGIA